MLNIILAMDTPDELGTAFAYMSSIDRSGPTTYEIQQEIPHANGSINIDDLNSLLFSAVKVSIVDKSGEPRSGSGFLWGTFVDGAPSFNPLEDRELGRVDRVFLFTNKHLAGLKCVDVDRKEISGEDRYFAIQINFALRSALEHRHISHVSRWESRDQSDGIITVKVSNPRWIAHPADLIDLCAFDMGDLLNNIDDRLATARRCVVLRLLNTKEYMQNGGVRLANVRQLPIGPGSEVFMLGYPSGWSDLCGLPLVRRGILSTDPRIGGGHCFLVDIASTPGSSGSPIIFRQETMRARLSDTGVATGRSGAYALADDEVLIEKTAQHFLLGILHAEKIVQSKLHFDPAKSRIPDHDVALYARGLLTKDELLEGVRSLYGNVACSTNLGIVIKTSAIEEIISVGS